VENAQAELVRKQRELDDAKREMELTIETRVSEMLGKIREQAKKEAERAVVPQDAGKRADDLFDAEAD